MRAAKLRHIGAAIEDVDFRTPRKLDRVRRDNQSESVASIRMRMPAG
jgi:hypothetical protein